MRVPGLIVPCPPSQVPESQMPPCPPPWPPARFPLASVLMAPRIKWQKKGRGPQAHLSRVVCLILGSSIFLSMCIVILRRSFC